MWATYSFVTSVPLQQALSFITFVCVCGANTQDTRNNPAEALPSLHHSGMRVSQPPGWEVLSSIRQRAAAASRSWSSAGGLQEGESRAAGSSQPLIWGRAPSPGPLRTSSMASGGFISAGTPEWRRHTLTRRSWFH